MSLRVAVQMDPILGINIDTDTSFLMMMEAQSRGHKLWFYTPDKLSQEDGRVFARAQPVKVFAEKGAHARLGETVVLEARKAVLAATAKTWELKGAGDAVATQRYADEEFAPLVTKYLKAQESFVGVLEKRREVVLAEAQGRRARYAVEGLIASALLMAVFLFLAWKLVRSITVPLDQAGTLIDAIAAGDLTQELRSERKDEFGHMLRALSRMAERLRGVVGEVRTGVEAVSLASSEIATGNQDLSARTEQTASNLEQTAASMEELTATVTQSADTARQPTSWPPMPRRPPRAASRAAPVLQASPLTTFSLPRLCL